MCNTDKLQLRGQNLGQVFNSRGGCVHAMQLHCFETKLPNLELKTRPKTTLRLSPINYQLFGKKIAPNSLCRQSPNL
jgi:hypothetical protein